MNGKTTKYYYYDSNKQSIVTVPVSLAKALSWNHLDEITIEIKSFEGKTGLFFYKKDHED